MFYQYRCEKCKSEIEIERSIHAEANAPLCITCHELMSRIWSSPAVTFNAPGFYVTDNKR